MFGVLSVLLGGLAFAPDKAAAWSEAAAAIWPAAPVADCFLPDGWSQIAERQPFYVVFGEIHGTREAPAFVGQIACALASKGERILLAIEQDSTINEALQDAWRAPADRFEQALLSTGWAERNDGVASQAMFGLLTRLHRLKQDGLPIAIVAFNGARDADQERRFSHLPGQGPHEAAQAQNIHDAVAAKKYDRVLVLVGNFHARRKRPFGEGAAQFEPMAMRLARFGKTLSLEMRDAGGTMWSCIARPGAKITLGQPIPDDAIECGIHSFKGDRDLDRPPFVRLAPFDAKGPASDYDGFVWLGPVHGSPPVSPGN